MGKKCTCILLKTNITNGYITIHKKQLDLFVFSVIFTSILGVCTLIQTSTLVIYSHVFNQNVKVYKSQLIWTSFWFDRQKVGLERFRKVLMFRIDPWSYYIHHKHSLHMILLNGEIFNNTFSYEINKSVLDHMSNEQTFEYNND